MIRKITPKPSKEYFDWETIHQRFTAIRSKDTQESDLSIEALERVWAEHARELAKPLVKEYEGKRINLVFFRLGDEVYALDVDYVYDICLMQHITPVPHVPVWVCGVYNLRGHILAVIDLHHFFGLQKYGGPRDAGSATSLVVIKTHETECAILVDQVLTVETLPVANILSSSEIVSGLQPEYVQGIVEVDGEDGNFTAVLLNIHAVMADDRLIVNQESR